MKCAAAWVLAFAVALTAVPVSYAEDAAGNPETDLTDQGDMAESGENPDMDPA